MISARPAATCGGAGGFFSFSSGGVAFAGQGNSKYRTTYPQETKSYPQFHGKNRQNRQNYPF